MNHIDTMKLALEALKEPLGFTGCREIDAKLCVAIAALTAALAEPSEPVYWQWRRKDKPWENVYIFAMELQATTDDSEVRKLFTHPAPQAPEQGPDKDLIQALTERDEYHDMADKLAEGIALHFDGDIGEHSSSNSPWDRALDLLDSAACAETMRLSSKPAPLPELTFEQIEDCFPEDTIVNDSGSVLASAQWLHDFARAILAAAREKAK